MKVLLLNDGGYFGLEGVEFPVQVEATPYRRNGVMMVTTEELIRVGADGNLFNGESIMTTWAFTQSQYEEIPDLARMAS